MQSSSSASEQATGIRMVSIESSDDYQTPPDHQLSSQNSSNDGQVPATKAAALDREIVRDGEMMVVDDSYDRKEKRMVDITKDSDNLEFLEKSRMILENNDTVLEDNNTLMVEVNDTEQIEVEYTIEEKAVNGAAEALAMLKEGASKVFVEMPPTEQEARMGNKNDSNHVDPKGKRRLPLSIYGTEKKHELFIDTMNRALKLLKGEVKAGVGGDDGDDDFLETAIRRGMTFPRPRWWPPEGDSED